MNKTTIKPTVIDRNTRTERSLFLKTAIIPVIKAIIEKMIAIAPIIDMLKGIISNSSVKI